MPSCECFDSEASCAAEAESRPGTTVVAYCPPGAEYEAPACAAEGENCSSAYLQSEQLAGCCDGTLCRPNAERIPVCQVGSEEELALDAECRAASLDRESEGLDLLTPTIETDQGKLVFREASGRVGVGPSGCLNSFDVRVGDGATCSLDIKIDLSEGRATTSVLGTVYGCQGFRASSELILGIVTSGPRLGFQFQGLSCLDDNAFESYCVAGTFDLEFDGEYGDVEFDEQHVRLEGVVCGGSPLGECF